MKQGIYRLIRSILFVITAALMGACVRGGNSYVIVINITDFPDGVVVLTYTDGTTVTVAMENGKGGIMPRNSVIKSISSEKTDDILIGRNDMTPINLRWSNNGLVFRDSVGGNIPIGSVGELQLLKDLPRDRKYQFRQDADIDLMNIAWSPVGSFSAPFTGIFDGTGYTVSNLKVSVTTPYCGLFGCLSQSVQLIGISISSGQISGDYYVGALCGYNDGGLISRCTNVGAVVGNTGVGGICGYNAGTVSGCNNSGVVSARQDVGGICAFNDNGGGVAACTNSGTIQGENVVSGICGRNNVDGIITGCTNSGTLLSNAGVSMGGICAENYGKPISASHNTGAITGDSQIGGICGKNTTAINKCDNSGTITGNQDVGGICGANFGSIFGSYNKGKISDAQLAGGICGKNDRGTVSGSYNTGEINGVTAGGVCGSNLCDIETTAFVTACYNTGTVNGQSTSGGITGINNGTLSACFSTGNITSASGGGICGYNIGSLLDCFWLNASNGINENVATADKTVTVALFADNSWPTADASKNWGLGDEPTGGLFWKKLGQWNVPTPTLPRLSWEED
ncbi:MAG: hypothetical protein LBR06_08560 [Bacteroidales bacterium]|nr:hypothetical protein [Bacteroidales bacterium]